MCCTRLAENTGRKNRHFGTIAQLYRAVSSQLRHVSTIGKNLWNINIFSTCPHNMVNFGLLMAEICWRVWGTPANFNGFRFLTALLHSILVVSIIQTAALNRGRHLYSAGRPSPWALAHILVSDNFTNLKVCFGVVCILQLICCYVGNVKVTFLWVLSIIFMLGRGNCQLIPRQNTDVSACYTAAVWTSYSTP